MMIRIDKLCTKAYVKKEEDDERKTKTCYAVAGAIIHNYYRVRRKADLISPADVKETVGREISDSKGMDPKEMLKGIGCFDTAVEPLPYDNFLLRLQNYLQRGKPLVLNIQIGSIIDEGASPTEHAVVAVGIEMGRGPRKIQVKDWLHGINREFQPTDGSTLHTGREGVISEMEYDGINGVWISHGDEYAPHRVVAAYATQRRMPRSRAS